MVEAFRMGYNCGVSIHPDIDGLQGEVRVPRDLTGVCVCVCVSLILPDKPENCNLVFYSHLTVKLKHVLPSSVLRPPAQCNQQCGGASG